MRWTTCKNCDDGEVLNQLYQDEPCQECEGSGKIECKCLCCDAWPQETSLFCEKCGPEWHEFLNTHDIHKAVQVNRDGVTWTVWTKHTWLFTSDKLAEWTHDNLRVGDKLELLDQDNKCVVSFYCDETGRAVEW